MLQRLVIDDVPDGDVVELILGVAETLGPGLVHEFEGSIRSDALDHVRRILDDGAIPLLAFNETRILGGILSHGHDCLLAGHAMAGRCGSRKLFEGFRGPSPMYDDSGLHTTRPGVASSGHIGDNGTRDPVDRSSGIASDEWPCLCRRPALCGFAVPRTLRGVGPWPSRSFSQSLTTQRFSRRYLEM